MSRSVLTSCMISAMGKSGARSSGPMGFSVPGCSGGAIGVGRSARMLYQARGMRLCGRLYWMVSMAGILAADCNDRLCETAALLPVLLHHFHHRQRFAVSQRHSDPLHLDITLEAIERHARECRAHFEALEAGLACGVLDGGEDQRA